MFDLEKTKTWETKKAIDRIAAQNLEFTLSLKPGLLFRPKGSFFLISSEHLLDLMDEHGLDWTKFYVEDFERLLNEDEDASLKLLPSFDSYRDYRYESDKWFFLTSVHCPVLLHQTTIFDFTVPEDKPEGYRFVEALCGEKQVFVCYGTTRLSLIDNELTFKDKKYTKQGTLDSLSKEVFSTKSKD